MKNDTLTAARLAAFSEFIDSGYPDTLSPETVDRRRFGKITKENGEVSDAYDAMVGENFRKGATGSLDDVLHELLDVAMASLAAYEHFTGNLGRALVALDAHVGQVAARAGIEVDA